MLSYKKQLGDSFLLDFTPLLGFTRKIRFGRKKHQDDLYYWKVFLRNNPSKRFVFFYFFLKKLSLPYPYRGVITNVGKKPILLFMDVNLAKEYYQKLYGNFEGDLVYFVNAFRQMGHYTLAGMEGEMWKHHRGLIGYALNFENIKKQPPNICQIANYYLNQFVKITLHLTFSFFLTFLFQNLD